MTQASLVRAKSRFHVLYRVVAIGDQKVNGPWKDYLGKAVPYMVACEQVDRMKVDPPTMRATYEVKAVYEKLVPQMLKGGQSS